GCLLSPACLDDAAELALAPALRPGRRSLHESLGLGFLEASDGQAGLVGARPLIDGIPLLLERDVTLSGAALADVRDQDHFNSLHILMWSKDSTSRPTDSPRSGRAARPWSSRRA